MMKTKRYFSENFSTTLLAGPCGRIVHLFILLEMLYRFLQLLIKVFLIRGRKFI